MTVSEAYEEVLKIVRARLREAMENPAFTSADHYGGEMYRNGRTEIESILNRLYDEGLEEGKNVTKVN